MIYTNDTNKEEVARIYVETKPILDSFFNEKIMVFVFIVIIFIKLLGMLNSSFDSAFPLL